MSSCKVLFFASLKDRAGTRQVTLDLPAGITVREFKTILGARFPSIIPLLTNALIAVNREYSMDEVVLPNEAEVAVFPPVSGGCSHIIS
jgi:molybdopterin converting factor subunit 1